MNEVGPTLVAVLATLLTALGVAFLRYWYRTKGISDASATVASFSPDVLLKVVGDQIAALSSRIDKLADSTTTSRSDITTKIDAAISATRDVFDQGADLRDTTTRIATALQGTGQRGSWGEMQLERVVELAGLTKHVTYKSQKTFKTEEEKEKTPDLIVYLPDDRLIPVDAKSPDLNLDGEDSMASKSLKKHIKHLAAKKYPSYVPGAIDFVVLFVPTESTLATALSEDLSLIEYAYKQGVLLTSPLTLLGMLRSVEYGWQQLSQIENVEKINDQAHVLCERSITLLEHFGGIQKGLSAAVEGYNNAVNSANSRLVPALMQMRELGVRTGKEVSELKDAPVVLSNPPKLLDTPAN